MEIFKERWKTVKEFKRWGKVQGRWEQAWNYREKSREDGKKSWEDKKSQG